MKINKNMQTIVFLYRGHLEEGTKIQKEKDKQSTYEKAFYKHITSRRTSSNGLHKDAKEARNLILSQIKSTTI